MKKQTKKYIWIGIGIAVILILIVSSYFGNGTHSWFFSVAGTCSPSSCSSGYTDNGIDCAFNGLSFECVRECYRAGGCGSYPSSWISTSNQCSNQANNDYCDSPLVSLDSNLCYQFYASISMMGGKVGDTPSSYTTTVSDPWDTTISSCNVGSVTTPTHVYGRGSDGNGYKSGGKITAYKSLTCSGSLQTSTSMSMTSYFYYKTAPYTTQDTQYKTCNGNVACVSPADCGQNGLTGDLYCSGNNLVQNYKTYSCSNYVCSSTDTPQTSQSCQYTCSGSSCSGACSNNEEKCMGTYSYLCENYGWANKGQIEGKCGYIIPTSGYNLVNNQCVFVSNSAQYSTLSECQEDIIPLVCTTDSDCPQTGCFGQMCSQGECVEKVGLSQPPCEGATWTASTCSWDTSTCTNPPKPNYLFIILGSLGIVLFVGLLIWILKKTARKR